MRPISIFLADDFPHETTPDRLTVGHGAPGLGARPRVPADRPEHLAADGASAALSPVTVGGVLRSKGKPTLHLGN